jgi:hypothetical protein
VPCVGHGHQREEIARKAPLLTLDGMSRSLDLGSVGGPEDDGVRPIVGRGLISDREIGGANNRGRRSERVPEEGGERVARTLSMSRSSSALGWTPPWLALAARARRSPSSSAGLPRALTR